MIYQVRSIPKPHYRMVIFRDSVPRDRYCFKDVREASHYAQMDIAPTWSGIAWSGKTMIQPSWIDRMVQRWFGGK